MVNEYAKKVQEQEGQLSAVSAEANKISETSFRLGIGRGVLGVIGLIEVLRRKLTPEELDASRPVFTKLIEPLAVVLDQAVTGVLPLFPEADMLIEIIGGKFPADYGSLKTLSAAPKIT